jgi:hypothetical protein
MAKTVEELMLPRYKVMADYPDSEFQVGEVLLQCKDGVRLVSLSRNMYVDWFKVEKWPSIFNKLEWWEERKTKELPDYVRDDNGVYKVKEWHTESAPKCSVFIIPAVHKGYTEDCSYCPLYSDFMPATAEEYAAYLATQPPTTT